MNTVGGAALFTDADLHPAFRGTAIMDEEPCSTPRQYAMACGPIPISALLGPPSLCNGACSPYRAIQACLATQQACRPATAAHGVAGPG